MRLVSAEEQMGTGAAEEATDRARLRSHLQALRRRWLLVVVVLVLTTGGSLAYSLTRTPDYRSSTEVLIEPTTADATRSTTGGITDEEVATQVQVVTSQRVADAVIADLGLPEGVDLARSMTVEPVGPSRILRITASASDPDDAAAIANAVAAAYLTDRTAGSQQLYQETRTLLTTRQSTISSRLQAVEKVLDSAKGAPPEAVAERQKLLGELGQVSAQLNDLDLAAQGGDSTGGRVITEAEPPATPATPRVWLNLGLAAVIGLILGIGAALLRHRFDDIVYEPQAVRQALRGSPLLATIPRWDDDRFDARLVSVVAGHSAAGEAFGGLGVNVRFLLSTRERGEGAPVVMVASARPLEGKSTVAANLAVAVARVGQRVTLVDADLRRGSLAGRFGLDPGLPGLSDLLADPGAEPTPFDVGIDHLGVIPCGTVPPNPTELLASHRMHAMLASLRESADLVVVDVPPMIVADGLELNDSVDLTLLVFRHGTSHRRDAASLVDRMFQLSSGSVAGVFVDHPVADSQVQTYEARVEGRGSRAALDVQRTA
ncbi:hypothetical protein GCM10023340_04160 [Nocardioides marinquilinus]|uniref:Polysaccharide chain length determinant N-terminal domain-containing protein n=1 Tax=Nocardioides marinquilinus TaxID=1210400 RepID=A0ABP9P784_9ACTN